MANSTFGRRAPVNVDGGTFTNFTHTFTTFILKFTCILITQLTATAAFAVRVTVAGEHGERDERGCGPRNRGSLREGSRPRTAGTKCVKRTATSKPTHEIDKEPGCRRPGSVSQLATTFIKFTTFTRASNWLSKNTFGRLARVNVESITFITFTTTPQTSHSQHPSAARAGIARVVRFTGGRA